MCIRDRGYETGSSATTGEAEAIIMGAIRELLFDKRENDTTASRQPSIEWVRESSSAGCAGGMTPPLVNDMSSLKLPKKKEEWD